MCTGTFVESDVSTAANGLQRPPAGTQCVDSCEIETGRWGSSWCYTEEDESQWGAECVPCQGLILRNNTLPNFLLYNKIYYISYITKLQFFSRLPMGWME